HIPPSLRGDQDLDRQLRAIRVHFENLPEHHDGFDFYKLKQEVRPKKTKGGEKDAGEAPEERRDKYSTSRAWIFQANPGRYALRRALAALPSQSWIVTQYRDEIAPGDRVYMWETGTPGGILAVGTVRGRPANMSSPPEEDPFILDAQKFQGERLRVIIENVEILDSPLSKEEIRSVAELRNLAVFLQPRGTNYKLTPSEAEQIAALVRQRTSSRPEVPHKPTILAPKPTLEWLADQTLWPKERLDEICTALLGESPQVVLAGPPGTSKTWVAKHL